MKFAPDDQMTTYQRITETGRILARKSQWATGEIVVCSIVTITGLSCAMYLAASGDWLPIAPIVLLSCAFARAGMQAVARHETHQAEIDKLAPRYMEQVEIDTREAFRIGRLAHDIAEGAGLNPDRRREGDRPDSESDRAVAAALAEGRDAPAISEAA